jgi:hypothetical protein
MGCLIGLVILAVFCLWGFYGVGVLLLILFVAGLMLADA